MKFGEVLSGLKKKKSEEVYLCVHPEHKSVVEIIAQSELEKWGETEGGYEIVYTASSRAEALEAVQNALLFAYQKDASMTEVKQNIREFFAKSDESENETAEGKEESEKKE